MNRTIYDILEELKANFKDLETSIQDYYKHRKFESHPFHNEVKETSKRNAIALINNYLIENLEDLSYLLKGAE